MRVVYDPVRDVSRQIAQIPRRRVHFVSDQPESKMPGSVQTKSRAGCQRGFSGKEAFRDRREPPGLGDLCSLEDFAVLIGAAGRTSDVARDHGGACRAGLEERCAPPDGTCTDFLPAAGDATFWYCHNVVLVEG